MARRVEAPGRKRWEWTPLENGTDEPDTAWCLQPDTLSEAEIDRRLEKGGYAESITRPLMDRVQKVSDDAGGTTAVTVRGLVRGDVISESTHSPATWRKHHPAAGCYIALARGDADELVLSLACTKGLRVVRWTKKAGVSQ